MKFKTNAFNRIEISLKSNKQYNNPFMDVDIDAVFTHQNGMMIKLPGFWNGGNEWKVRFSSEVPGEWSYKVVCSDKDNDLLFDSGIVEVLPCVCPKNELEKHGYVRLEKEKRYMVYNDGTPFFYLGDTHWMMPDFERLHECNYPGCNCGNQFKHLADDRIKKGFNVYQTYFSSSRKTTHHSGTPSWWSEPYTLINPEAFNESMDIMIEYLAENGITTALGFGTHNSTVKEFQQNITAMLAFARYCVARYACYPLIWITAQEITGNEENAFTLWKQVASYVGEIDGYHRPNGAHMYVQSADSPTSIELNNEPWHQWWTLQGGHGGYANIRSRYFYEGYRKLDKIKPYIESESQYEDIYCCGFCGHDAPRMAAWQAVQSGSAGFTYGVTGIWALGWHQKYDPELIDYSPESWFSGMDKPGSQQVCYMKKFYEYVEWYKLEPSFDFEFGVFDSRQHVSISHIGQDLFVYYFFSKDDEKGFLTGLSKNTIYQARWFDPINGKFIDLPDIITPDGKFNVPVRPSLRDWVLLLNTYELGEYDCFTYPKYADPVYSYSTKFGDEIKILKVSTSSEDENHPGINLVDNNPNTYWQGFALRTSQTITLEFEKKQAVEYLYLRCDMPKLRFVELRIYGTNDTENFEMLREYLNYNVSIGGNSSDVYIPINGNYKYIQLFFNSVESSEYDSSLQLSKIAVLKGKNTKISE